MTAWLTARWSLKRFRSEKWWERKADAYARIVSALFHMQRYADDWIESFEESRDTPPTRKKELEENFRRARADVEEATTLGAFVISSAAAASLGTLRGELQRARRQDDLYELACIESTALGKCLDEIRKIAKHDLGVESTVILIRDK